MQQEIHDVPIYRLILTAKVIPKVGSFKDTKQTNEHLGLYYNKMSKCEISFPTTTIRNELPSLMAQTFFI